LSQEAWDVAQSSVSRDISRLWPEIVGALAGDDNIFLLL